MSLSLEDQLIELVNNNSGDDTSEMQQLIDAGVDVNYSAYFFTALMICAAFSKHNQVALLIRAGVNVDFVSQYGANALQCAVESLPSEKQRLVIEHLLDAGVDIEQTNVRGRSPLYFAAISNNKRTVVQLLSAGACICARDFSLPYKRDSVVSKQRTVEIKSLFKAALRKRALVSYAQSSLALKSLDLPVLLVIHVCNQLLRIHGSIKLAAQWDIAKRVKQA